jgi:hypothetical protein
MGGRRYHEATGGTATGHTLGSAMLRAIGQGFMIMTLGFCVSALLGSTSEMDSLGAIVTTGALGSGCLFASAALRNAERERLQAEREEPRQSIGTVSLAVSRGLGIEQDAVVCAELQADHVARLARERQERQAGRGPCV